MTTIHALTRLHYGAPYLDACIRSTEGLAEKHWVVYAERHNFPGNPTIPCPDTRDQLLEIAQRAGGDRLMWIDHPAPGVDVVLRDHPEIDLMIELDSDEIAHQDLAVDIKRRMESGDLMFQKYRLPFVHHWRSFRYACTDAQWPVRLYLQHAQVAETVFYPMPEPARYVHHFGYVLPRVYMDYKWMLSIHRPELRPEWFEEIYARFPERLTDLHPVSHELWNAQPFADGDLPAVLINHPYRYLEMVD